MARRVLSLPLVVAVLFSGLIAEAASADTTVPLPLPRSMAAVGDSISQAASTAGSLGADAPQNSWSTGTSTTVNSHYLRLLALGAPISGQNNNLSVSGSKAINLNAQMQNVVALQPDYVTAQIGGNDLCTSTFAAMTPVSDFRAQVLAAMTTLTNGAPDTHVLLTSIPDAYQLWSLFRNDWWARFIWSAGGVCQSLLANPTSTQQVDVDRRAAVRQRNIDYNTQLAEVCSTFVNCRFDGNAVFNTRFTTSDVAGDYFHPSVAGQAKLSAASWAAGYAWAVTPPPPPPTPMWIGSLTSTTTSARNSWTATVTVSVVDASGPVSGATVTGTWSAGSGATSCSTNASGVCSLKSSSLSRKQTPSVIFTAGGVTKTGWTYDSGRNAQTSITINRP